MDVGWTHVHALVGVGVNNVLFAVLCALYVFCGGVVLLCYAMLCYDSRCNQQMNNVITLCGVVLDFIARETPKSVLHVGHCTLNEGIV